MIIHWSCLADICEDISLEATVDLLRIKLKLPRIAFRLLGVDSSPDPDARSRLVSVSYVALIAQHSLDSWLAQNERFAHVLIAANEREVAKFHYRYDGEAVTPASGHGSIIAMAVHYLRRNLDNSLIAFEGLESSFTLLELQRVHEMILGHPLEKVLFRKRMLARIFSGSRMLRPNGKYQQAQGRPAKLYELRRIN